MTELLLFEYAGNFASLTEKVKRYVSIVSSNEWERICVDYLDLDSARVTDNSFTVKITVTVTPDETMTKRIRTHITAYDRPRGKCGDVMIEYSSRLMNMADFVDGRVESAVRRVVKRAETLSALREL